MERLLTRYSSYGYALFRIVFGLMFMFHGTQKIFNFPAGKGGGASGMMFAAGIIEIVCGALILVGFFTSIAAIVACGEMAFAYFMAHQPNGALPIMNGGELAVLYCFAFLYMATRGSGIFSVDSVMRAGSSSG